MTGVVTPYSLMFSGVALAVLPIAPLPGAAYLRGWLRSRPLVAIVWYAAAVAGCIWTAVAFYSRQPQLQWAIGLGLALSWWFLATHTVQEQREEKKKSDTKRDTRDTQGGDADA
jgi:hypothetical protein